MGLRDEPERLREYNRLTKAISRTEDEETISFFKRMRKKLLKPKH